MTAHAMHNASSSDYWLECGHYYQHKLAATAAGEDYDPDNIHSVRGHHLHAVAEKALAILLRAADWSVVLVEAAVEDQIEWLELSDELSADDAAQCVTALIGVLELIDVLDKQSETPLVVRLETKAPLSHEPESVGTIDVSIEGADFLAIVDYKFGAGEIHPDCSQLWTYAANMALRVRPKRRIIMGIMQPKLRTEVITIERPWDKLVEFRGHVNHTVAKQKAGAVYGPSEISTCQYCPFQSRCSAYTALLTGAARTVANATSDAQIEWLVVNKTAIEDGLQVLSGVVQREVDRFPNWSRREQENPAKWNPAVDPGEIAHQLRLKGVVEPYQLRTPAALRDEYPDVVGTINQFVLERSTHIRLTRPTTAPDLKVEIKTREIKAVLERDAAAKAAKQTEKDLIKAEKLAAKKAERADGRPTASKRTKETK